MRQIQAILVALLALCVWSVEATNLTITVMHDDAPNVSFCRCVRACANETTKGGTTALSFSPYCSIGNHLDVFQ